MESDSKNSADSFSVEKGDNVHLEFDEHDFDYNCHREDVNKLDEIYNIDAKELNFTSSLSFPLNVNSKIGIENSEELSQINRMYDVLYTEKMTLENIEAIMNNTDQRNKNADDNPPDDENNDGSIRVFGLEEDAKLSEAEKIKIVNTVLVSKAGRKHHEYKITGKYKDEEFTIMRRYKEFHLLHKVLQDRWPGFFIPPIPRKKTYGKLEFKVISERVFILNRFLDEISKRRYLWDSEEMRIFIIPETNLVAGLKALKPLSIEEVLERIRPEAEMNVKITDELLEDYFIYLKTYKEQVMNNLSFLNRFKTFVVKQ